jgi:hypothetical protein
MSKFLFFVYIEAICALYAFHLCSALNNMSACMPWYSVLAISGVTSGKETEVDVHPERRMKAAYAAFEDREMAILKDENSSLKRSQMKDQIWKKVGYDQILKQILLL